MLTLQKSNFMVITKDKLQHIVDTMPEKVDVEEVFDKILLSAKVEQALLESEQGLGQDWEEFKAEWLKEDL
jgi:hypothetical protein